MTHPVPDIEYRIQHLGYLTYLEVVDGSIELRPAKETDHQYWKFEHVLGSSYYARNVANSKQYLCFNDPLITVIGAPTNNSLVNVSYQDGAYKLAFYYSSINYYFYTNGTAVYGTSHNTNQKWQLVPVIDKDLLQSGAYRIRNFNGKSLLTMSDKQSIGSTTVYVRSQSGHSAYQRWTVTRQHSGQYTIQNAGNNSYLGSSPTAVVGDGLAGSQDVYLWDIRSVGRYAWSLCIPGLKLSVGAANYEIEDGDEMSLVPSDITPSQIWFMEKYIPLGQDKIHAKREVGEGRYLLQQTTNGHTVHMNAFSIPWRITPGTATTSKFELKYVDENSSHFTLTYVTTSKPAPVVVDVGGYLGLAGKGSEFVLLETHERNPGYVIYRPDTGRARKVVSGRATTDINRNSVFAIEDMVAGDPMQMWTLVPA